MKKLIFSVLQMFLSVTLMFADNFKSVLYQNDNLPTAIYQSDSYPWKVGNGYVASSNYSASNYSQYYHDSHSTSWFEAEIYAGEDSALVSFEYQVDYYYEGGNGWGGGWTYGNLYFKIDGVEYLRCSKTAEWGESPSWMKAEFKVAKGYHVLRWEFKMGDVAGMQTGSEIAKVRNLDIDKNNVDNGFLVLNKKTINFKNKEAGSSTLDTLELHNVGTKDVHITYIDGPSAPYKIIGEVSNFAIPAGGKKNIVVSYTPIDEGYWEQYIDVESTQGIQTVKIKGLCHNGYVVDNPTPGQLEHVVTNKKCDSLTIIGTLNGTDQNFLHELKNLKYLNLLGTDIEIIQNGGVGNLSGLEELLLPSTWKYIDYYMWQSPSWNSETKREEYLKLTSVTTLATEPPTVRHYEGEDGSFKGIKEGTLLYVPVASLSTYSDSEQWSRFTILPITEELKTLKVVLPQNEDYKNMILELKNTKNGQKQRFVITDKNTYTFKGLQTKYSYNVIMRTPEGVELGSIKNILLEEEHKEVRFSKLLPLGKASLSVLLLPDSTDVTDKVQVNWYSKTETFLSQGNSIMSRLYGDSLKYEIKFDEELGKQYIQPSTQNCIIKDSMTQITQFILPYEKRQISGVVSNTLGVPLRNVNVSLLQTLNNQYTTTILDRTDENGSFAIQASDTPTKLLLSATDYFNVEIILENISKDTCIENITMRPIEGARINTQLLFKPSVAIGEENATETSYSDFANVTYKVYNLSTDSVLNKIAIQHPIIVLLDEVNSGDSLSIVANSKNSMFTPVCDTVIINDRLEADAIFTIKELGRIHASFTTTDCASVAGLLYNDKGELTQKAIYQNDTLNVTDLQDGTYTLVTIMESNLFNSISNISQFDIVGFKKGNEYISNEVKVESGHITTIHNEVIPTFNEEQFYYTGSNTYFSINKSSVVAGNYLTLNSFVDFKAKYIDHVSDVELIITLPSFCQFVENSAIIGNESVPYIIEDNQITIGMNDMSNRMRCCFIPLQGGTYHINALVKFRLHGIEMVQPIGNVNCDIKNWSLKVPTFTTKSQINVSGTSRSKTDVLVYDNEILIGKTQSDGFGNWELNCDLNSPHGFTFHNIHAEFAFGNAIIPTETKEVIYRANYPSVKNVIMLYQGYNIKFDFENSRTSSNYYSYVPDHTNFTFLITLSDTLSNNRDVYLNVLTSNGETHEYEATFDSLKNIYFVNAEFANSNSIPVNVSVNIDSYEYLPYDNSGLFEEELGNIEYHYHTLENDIINFNSDISLINNSDEHMSFMLSNSINSSQLKISVYKNEEIANQSTRSMEYSNLLYEPIEIKFENLIISTQLSQNGEISIRYINNTEGWVVELSSSSTNIQNTFGIENAINQIDKRLNLFYELFGYNADDRVIALKHLETMQNILDNYLDQLYRNSEVLIHLLKSECEGGGDALNNTQYEYFYSKYQEINEAIELFGNTYINYIELYDAKNKLHAWQCIIDAVGNCILTLLNAGDNISNSMSNSVRCWNKYKDILKIIEKNKFAAFFAKSSLDKWITNSISVISDASKKNYDKINIDDDFMSTADDLESFANENFSQISKRIKLLKKEVLDSIHCKTAKQPTKKKTEFPLENIKPSIDPSGYVYEGVPSNRLQGVTATVYYKETVEDMYGDKHEEVRMWDAEEYGQQNPLITDEYGMYRWDVPQGLWQVKFEKEGYETTYSDWLPVPPPQLDVNIAMKQFVQPEVKEVRAYESGIVIEFEKYMLPDSLNTNNIRAMKADSTWVNGQIEWANREQVSDTDSLAFVSKVKFIPDTPFLPTDTVTLIINSHVVSYTGIQMEEDYVKTFCITNEVTGMEVDSLVRVLYGGEKELVINAVPSFAAAGKRLIVGMSSTMIASVDADTLTFDVNGQATLTVKGELPGFTILSMQVDSTDIQAVTSVFVGNAAQITTIAPRASLASGIEVESGTTVALTCETANAVIYYTLDGSCPCDGSTRFTYTTPIVIDKDLTIKAIAFNQELGESEIVTYIYKVKNVDETEREVMSASTITCLPISGGVEVDGVRNLDVSIFNLQGLLMHKSLDLKRNKLFIKLPEGLYIVKVHGKTFKVLVKK